MVQGADTSLIKDAEGAGSRQVCWPYPGPPWLHDPAGQSAPQLTDERAILTELFYPLSSVVYEV